MKLKATMSIFVVVLLIFVVVLISVFFGSKKTSNINNQKNAENLIDKNISDRLQQSQLSPAEQVVKSLENMQAAEQKDPEIEKKRQTVVESLQTMQEAEKKDENIEEKYQAVSDFLNTTSTK